VQIFASSQCPIESALALDDARVRKMIVESAQLMSGAVNIHGGVAPYKTTHVNHPCAVWTRTNRENYMWLFQHFSALLGEYRDRFGRTHTCRDLIGDLFKGRLVIPYGPRTEFANCAANKELQLSYKHISPVTDAYREYLTTRWNMGKPKWTKTKSPDWY
jgi:hypothetical protein